MTHKSEGLRYLARCTTLVAVAVTSAALTLTSATAQQERSQRSDRSSGRDDSSTSRDQSTQRDQSDPSTQADQQRPDQQRRSNQSTDRASQDRSGDQSRQQYSRDQGQQTQGQQTQGQQTQGQQTQGQQSRGQYREASRDQYRDQSGRDQLRDQSQLRGQSGRSGEGLGISFDQQQQGQSLTVRDVQQGTTAAQAGLRAGDQILAVDGRSISSQQQFLSQLSSQPGRQVPVVIVRNGRQYTVHLTADQLGGQQGQQEGDVAWLGVMLQEGQGNQQGAQVTQIYPAGPAARAGLRSGDVITSVDGERVEDSSSLIEAIENHQPGGRAQLTITRNNQQMNVPVTLGSREAFAWRGGGDEQWGGQFGGQYTSSGQSGGQSESRGGQSGSDDHYSSLPPFAMQLEHERRMYEQHQRIESKITELQDEVRQLRELIQQQQRR